MIFTRVPVAVSIQRETGIKVNSFLVGTSSRTSCVCLCYRITIDKLGACRKEEMSLTTRLRVCRVFRRCSWRSLFTLLQACLMPRKALASVFVSGIFATTRENSVKNNAHSGAKRSRTQRNNNTRYSRKNASLDTMWLGLASFPSSQMRTFGYVS